MALFPRKPGDFADEESDSMMGDEAQADTLLQSVARSPNALRILSRTSGSSVLGQMFGGGKSGMILRPQIRQVLGPDGKPYLQEFIPTPEGNFMPGRILAGQFVAPFVAQSAEGPLKVPRVPGEPAELVRGPAGQRIGPPPSEETQQRLGAIQSFRQNLTKYETELPAFLGQPRQQGFVAERKRELQGFVRGFGKPGQEVSEAMGPEGELVEARRDFIMADFVRIMSGLQASEKEQTRLGRVLSGIGAGTPEFARSKITQFRESVDNFIRERARLRPDLFTDQTLNELGFTREEFEQMRTMASHQPTGPTTDLPSAQHRTGKGAIRRTALDSLSAAARAVAERRIAEGSLDVIEDR